MENKKTVFVVYDSSDGEYRSSADAVAAFDTLEEAEEYRNRAPEFAIKTIGGNNAL